MHGTPPPHPTPHNIANLCTDKPMATCARNGYRVRGTDNPQKRACAHHGEEAVALRVHSHTISSRIESSHSKLVANTEGDIQTGRKCIKSMTFAVSKTYIVPQRAPPPPTKPPHAPVHGNHRRECAASRQQQKKENSKSQNTAKQKELPCRSWWIATDGIASRSLSLSFHSLTFSLLLLSRCAVPPHSWAMVEAQSMSTYLSLAL